MTKGKNGKETKKPKKVRVPNPPGLPANLAPVNHSSRPPKR
jgi:hypothetical protein